MQPASLDDRERLVRNYQRTWLYVFIVDKSFCITTGRAPRVSWREVPTMVSDWWLHPAAATLDRVLCGVVEMRTVLVWLTIHQLYDRKVLMAHVAAPSVRREPANGENKKSRLQLAEAQLQTSGRSAKFAMYARRPVVRSVSARHSFLPRPLHSRHQYSCNAGVGFHWCRQDIVLTTDHQRSHKNDRSPPIRPVPIPTCGRYA